MTKLHKTQSALLGCITALTLAGPVMAEGFKGRVLVEWLQHDKADRLVQLKEPFAFVDAAGTKWYVPADTIVDGASIPSVFWNTVGPPFVGDYRYATVIHDYYCDIKTESWKDTHRMFLEASIAGGVSRIKAKMMYAGVYSFGPRWETTTTIGLEGPETLVIALPTPRITDEEVEELRNRIEDEDLSVEEIEEAIDTIR